MEIPNGLNKEEVADACQFICDCLQLKDVRLDSDFGVTLIGLLKGMGVIIKDKDPQLYVTICEALSILANR